MAQYQKLIHQDGLIINPKQAFDKLQVAAYKNIDIAVRAITKQYGIVSDSLSVGDELKVRILEDKPGKITFRANPGLIVRDSGGVEFINFPLGADVSFTYGNTGNYYIYGRNERHKIQQGKFKPGYKRKTTGNHLFEIETGKLFVTSNLTSGASLLYRFTISRNAYRTNYGVSCCTSMVDMRTIYSTKYFDPWNHTKNSDTGTSSEEFYVLYHSASAREKLFHKNNLIPDTSFGSLRIYNSSNVSIIPNCNVGDRIIIFSDDNFGFYEVLATGSYGEVSFVPGGSENPVVVGVSMNVSTYSAPSPNDPVLRSYE